MLAELDELLAVVPHGAHREAYANAIIHENVLAKATAATRRWTYQRLRELYGLNPGLPLFRVFRHLWAADEAGRPLLALLCALARDPLLRATATAVLPLRSGAELVRGTLIDILREAVGSRLNDAVLDKVARNAASSWSQSGHLAGRMRKLRQRVSPTPGSMAMVLWLGVLEDLSGPSLLASRWSRVLDRAAPELLPVALEAKRLGLIRARLGNGVIEMDTGPLVEPAVTRR